MSPVLLGVAHTALHTRNLADEPGAIRECPERFATNLRGAWHRVTGEEYFIDSAGRPKEARAVIPPFAEDGRLNQCQRAVGGWGKAADPSTVYHGGHMIGCQLGGWGGRANMVPQVGGFNSGNWLQLENALHDCGDDLAAGRLEMHVLVSYANGSTLVPQTMRMTLTDLENGDSITLTFQNVEKGGRDGEATRKRGVQWLRRLGCKRDATPTPTSICRGS